MRPTDFPATGLSEPGGGSWCGGSDEAEDSLLDLVGEL
jgi:hypothetical protein